MKRITLTAVAAQLLLASGANAAGWFGTQDPALQPAVQPPTLESLMSPTSEAVTGVNSIRAQLLMEGGRTVGFQGGLSSRSAEILAGLQRRQRALDVQYEFGSLVSTAGLLPPVIVEARDIAAFAPDQIRTANRVYKIERGERFVSVPPTWRDYLLIGLPLTAAVELPIMEARPVDKAEMRVWQEAVSQGWREGEEAAGAIVEANFNRLTRDYTGMLLYSTLVQQGMIGTSTVSDSVQTVTGDTGELTLGDRIKRLTGRAGFQTDSTKWRPTIKVGALPPARPVVKPETTPVASPIGSEQAPALATAAPSASPISSSASNTAKSAVPPKAAVAPVSSRPAQPPTPTKAPLPLAKTEKPVELIKPLPVVKPVAPKPAVPKEKWVAEAGSTLRESLESWAQRAGWYVDWKPEDLNYGVSAPIRLEGSFEEVISQLFALYDRAERPMTIIASRTQKLIRITEKTFETPQIQAGKSQ